MPLTTYILVKNHEKTIEETLKSLLPLQCKIVVGDSGSTDRTLEICRKYDLEIKKVPFTKDYAAVKNKLMTEDGWRFWIEPWETLLKGQKAMLEAIQGKPASYRIQILQGHVINKEVRLWHSKENKFFYNPIYETVDDANSVFLNIIVASSPKPNQNEQWEILESWKTARPTDAEPYYFQSFILLAQKKYKEFLNSIDKFIFAGGEGQSATMAKYYMATVQLYANKDASAAIRNILPCIAVMPLMAEFWCVLGDVYYYKKQYQKARTFYENAIILGSRRLKSDSWPLEIPKYHEYPTKMISSCNDILEGIKTYQVR